MLIKVLPCSKHDLSSKLNLWLANVLILLSYSLSLASSWFILRLFEEENLSSDLGASYSKSKYDRWIKNRKYEYN